MHVDEANVKRETSSSSLTSTPTSIKTSIEPLSPPNLEIKPENHIKTQTPLRSSLTEKYSSEHLATLLGKSPSVVQQQQTPQPQPQSYSVTEEQAKPTKLQTPTPTPTISSSMLTQSHVSTTTTSSSSLMSSKAEAPRIKLLEQTNKAYVNENASLLEKIRNLELQLAEREKKCSDSEKVICESTNLFMAGR